ncbi:hypothetical protein QEZ54_06705 [Catellatospora sp. KI3]|uniref:hypothetical protein n=1 Tax=Catellatospora sp. KI3 TaxID=3041620 RepID=UPI00248326B2|nr:hypothetical protein [Catellatospora sp. KI3]MDI1460648.1 hypothetical protein [Catellatospora sp. KI3]
MNAVPLVRRAVVAGVAVAVAVAATVVQAAPASAALPGPAGIPCKAANHGQIEATVSSAEVSPTLTHFISVNITAGTTGERTETLSVMNTVTTTVGASTNITAAFSIGLVKVSTTLGFSVQTSTSSTTTETTSMRWTFNQPGYYGLYKGTRKVTGSFQLWRCFAPPGSRGGWVEAFPSSPIDFINDPFPYTTFANFEAGTIACGDSVPVGSLRFMARQQLGC